MEAKNTHFREAREEKGKECREECGGEKHLRGGGGGDGGGVSLEGGRIRHLAVAVALNLNHLARPMLQQELAMLVVLHLW